MKRIVTLLLALVMFLGMLPTLPIHVHATEPEGLAVEETVPVENVEATTEQEDLLVEETVPVEKIEPATEPEGLVGEETVLVENAETTIELAEEQFEQSDSITISGAQNDSKGIPNYMVYAKEGDTVSFGPSTLDSVEYAYQWQVFDTNSNRFVNIGLEENPTAKSENLTINVTQSVIGPAPLYQCVLTEGEESAVATFTITDETPVCNTADELVSRLKEQMKLRKKYFSAELLAGASINENGLWGKVFAHTGVPTEGEYLDNHCTSLTWDKTETETGNLLFSFKMEYITTYEQEKILDAAITDIVNQIDTTTNYSAISGVYQYITENVVYDDYHYGSLVDHYSNRIKQTAYGALIDGTAVCEGFASLFYRMALECGVDTRMIVGVALGEGHGWNIALSDDGIYYGVDATWGLFMYGEMAYEEGNYYPNKEYLTDEFKAAYPMVWDNYVSTVDYSYDEATATLTIHSDMEDFLKWQVYITSPWTTEMQSQVEHVVIEEGVTQIGDYAFSKFSNLKTVSLPDSLRRIGDYAFNLCTSIEAVSLPENLVEIGEYAFQSAISGGSIRIPQGLTEIKDGTFCDCAITEVIFPENSKIKRIGAKAFRQNNITSITIPAAVEELGSEAFRTCRLLTTVAFQNNSKLKTIGDAAFQTCMELQNVELPSSLEYIGNKAFCNSHKVGNLSLPDNLIYIGAEAFYGCSITEIELPKNLEYIGDYALSGSTINTLHIPANVNKIGNAALSTAQSVTVDAKNQWFCLVDGVLYTRDRSGLVWFPRNYEGTHFSIPEGVQWITYDAFKYLKIQTIDLPDSLRAIPKGAFEGCKNLTSIQIPDSVCEIGESAFLRSGLVSVEIPGSVDSIGRSAFEECDDLSSVILKEGTRVLEHRCFYKCNNIQVLELPLTLQTVSTSVLTSKVGQIRYHGTKEDWKEIKNECTTWLNESTITFVGTENNPGSDSGDKVTVTFDGNGESISVDSITCTYSSTYGELPIPSVEGKIFYGWFTAPEGGERITSESTVLVAQNQTLYAHWENTIIAEGSEGSIHWTIHNNGELVISGNGQISNYTSAANTPWSTYGQQITKLTIGNGIAAIGDYAFAKLEYVTEISIPEGVLTIGVDSFSDCKALTEICLPEGLHTISDYAFQRCQALATIRFPDSLQKIGGFAFRGCDALKSIELPNHLETIGEYAFSMAEGLQEIRIPESVKSIGQMTFYDCPVLESVTIETSQVERVNGMFHNCTALAEISLPEGFAALGVDMFKGCTSLTEIQIPNSVEVIDQYAFAGCTNLKKVVCGSGLKRIADAAFSECSSLEKINLPNSLWKIENNAFANCTSLQSVSIPTSVDTIGHGAFSGCASLKEITLPESVSSWGVFSFARCTALERVELSAAVDRIPQGSFDSCSALSVVHLHHPVNSVDNLAFNDCDSLETIYWYYPRESWETVGVAAGNEDLMSANLICQFSSIVPITLDANGGSVETTEIEVAYGEHYGELPIPTKEGCLFAGWTDALNGGKYIQDSTYVTCGTQHTLYAQWYEILESAAINENLQWTIYENGTLLIQGAGEMGDLSVIPWAHRKGQIRNVIVEDGVGNICSNAFSGCAALRTVTLSETVKEIGEYAFYQCYSLRNISLPKSVIKVGAYAFAECTSLLSAEMTANAVDLGSHIFYQCTKLQTAILSATSPYILSGCTALKTAEILNDVTMIAEHSFEDCGITCFSFPETVKVIEGYAFQRTQLQEAILPEGLVTIGEYAFYRAESLTKVLLPKSLETISEYAFFATKITEAHIHKNVHSIGSYAFDYCSHLENVYVTDITAWCNISFGKNMAGPTCRSGRLRFLDADGKEMTEIVLDDSLVKIPDYAFCGSTVTSITIPDSVTYIGKYAFYRCVDLKNIILSEKLDKIDHNAFASCVKLESIILPNSVDSIGYSAFSGCSSLKSLSIPKNVPYIEVYTFSGCSSLTSITIPERVVKIDSYAFAHCERLTSIVIPGVDRLGSGAFSGCSSLVSVSLPKSLTTIGDSPFLNCDKLRDIYYSGTAEQWSQLSNLPSVTYVHYSCTTAEDHWKTEAVAATCTEEGFISDTCICGYECNKVSTEAATGHTWADADCDSPKTCYECGSTDGDPLGHTWVDADCENPKTCSVCGNTDGDPLGHDWTNIACTGIKNCQRCELSENNEHDWAEATCTEPRTCKRCEETGGEALGHDWTEATCTEPRTCKRCEETEGEALRHDWAEATCAEPKTCKRCKETEGETLDHTWKDADCITPKTCSVCSATEGEALGHSWIAADCDTPKTCSVCSATEGDVDYSVHTFTNGICSCCMLPEGLGYTVENGTVTVKGYTGSLTEFSIPATIEGNTVAAIGKDAFYGCRSSLTSITIPDGVTSIGAGAFYLCSSLTSITIPESVTSIGDDAFGGCKSLTSMTIPDSVTSIGASVFESCSGLTSVTMLGSVTSIGERAFINCNSLTSITIPESVTSIGNHAFGNCSSLTDVYITDVAAWLDIAFANDTANPLRANYNGKNLYLNGELLTELVIPEGVTSIVNYAFYSCSSLMSITIPDSVTSIGSSTFNNCSSLWHVLYTGSDAQWRNVAIAGGNTKLTAAIRHNSATGSELQKTSYCTQSGIYCTACNQYFNKQGEIITHSWVAADCDTPKTCSACSTTEGEALGHCWQEATCTNPKTCGTCNAREGLALDHSWVAADCDTPKTCSVCSATEGESLGHTWVDADCDTPKTCSVCSATEGAALGHTWVDADCVTPKTCSVCSATEGEALGHTWVAADCDTPKTCSVCSATEGAALGHTWVDADCDTPKTCSVCSATEGEALGHTWVAADCDTPKTCSVCSATEGEALGHTWADADCDTPKTCAVCSATEGEALGHTWVAADCDTPKTCAVCSATEGEALGHNWQNVTCVTPKTCSRCSAIEGEALGHNWVEANCTAPKTCNRCGSTEGNPTGHNNWIAATCTNPKTCADCDFVEGEALGHSFSDATCTEPKICGTCNTREGLPLGHSWVAADCDTPKTCSVCSATEGAALGHNFVGGTCSRCEEEDPNYVSFGIITQPESVTVPNGATAKTTVQAQGEGLTYTWYFTSNGSSTKFSKSSTTTATYSTTMDATRDGRKVYCVITDKYGNSVTTDTVTLSMEKTPLVITQQPADVTVVNGASAKTTVKATGDGLKYTWYFTSGGSATKFSKSSATSATYSTTMNADRSGRQVYCVITDAYGRSVTSDTATLYMKEAIKITAQPQNVKVPANQTATVTVEAEGEGLTYTWYYANKGKTTFTKSSYTTNTYSTIMDSTRDGRRVYCKITDKLGNSVKTVTVTMTMHTPLVITQQPANVMAAAGAKAATTVKAEGDGLKYAWYYTSGGSSTTFSKSSITTATYSTTMDTARDGRQVYCVITDKHGDSVTTNTVTLSMKPRTPLVITQQPANVSVGSGATAKTTVKAEGDGLTYAWYFTTNAADTTFSKSSITTASYSTTMDASRDGRKVYCIVTDQYGNTAKTNTVTLSMEKTPLAITQQPADVTVAKGAKAATTVKATGDGLKYTWYFTSGGTSTKFSKSSITSATYSTTMDATRNGRRVYCVITDAYGRSVTTETVTLSMAQSSTGTPLKIVTQPVSVTVANGATAKATVVAQGDGLTYAWYYTSNGTATKFYKSSTTTATYSTTMDSSRDGRQIYCVITDQYGNTVTTNTVTLKMS